MENLKRTFDVEEERAITVLKQTTQDPAEMQAYIKDMERRMEQIYREQVAEMSKAVDASLDAIKPPPDITSSSSTSKPESSTSTSTSDECK